MKELKIINGIIMKRIVIQFLACSAMCVLITAITPNAIAKKVDSLSARNMAEAFLASKGMRSGLQNITPTEWQGTLYLYATGQKGYILISADDAVKPILAYSTEAAFPTENIPPQVRSLIQFYSDLVEYARQQHLRRHPSWKKIKSGAEFPPHSRASVGPLVTATWEQSYPYNTLCPPDSSWDLALPCVTGCVATAMAQIMHYWRWPDIGWGENEYLWTDFQLNPVRTLSEQFDTVHYQWDLMPNVLDSLSSEAEIYAVSRLMYDCGVAVNMHYSFTGSGSFVWNEWNPSAPSAGQALRTYFRYHPTIQYVSRKYYTDSEWLDLIQNEIDAGRPVLYSAADPTLGPHAHVVDGYDEERRLHFNIGWGGLYNGFYAIDSVCLAPDIDFSFYHDALIGIRPNFEECDPAVIQAVADDTLAGYCTGGGQYAYGDSVSLVAHTYEGYRFDGWTSGSHENPHYLPATTCLSDTACIRRIDSDTLYYGTSLSNDSWDFAKTGNITRWGIRVPASCLHDRCVLSSVQFYKPFPDDDNIRLNIYSGNHPDDSFSVYEHNYDIPYEFKGWFPLAIDDYNVIDTTKDMWIIITINNSIFNWSIHSRSTYSGNSDGCWFYNSTGWHTLDSVGLWATWKIRAILSPYPDTIMGNNDPQAEHDPVIVYPNPTYGKVTISSDETLVSAYLTDMLGRHEEVYPVPHDSGLYSIDLSTHPNATYLLTLVAADGKRHTVKLILRDC